jgi:prepilin-type N-terminal cleavage/methylation domain-containing protein
MNKSFTLIEILVVIVIIGILSAFIIVSMAGVSQKATIAKGQAFSSSLKNSLMMNLVSEWKLDGNANDSWGTNNGTLVGATHLPVLKTGSECISGSCYQFDGTEDCINCGNDSSVNLVSSATMEAWVKFISLDGWGAILAKGCNGTDGYRFYISQSSHKINLESRDSLGNLNSISSLNAIIDTGRWYFLAGTLNSGGNGYVMVNGEKGAVTGTPYNIGITANTLRIGSCGGGQFLNGLIDEVRIYNAAIPASQIQENYYAGLNRLFVASELNKAEYNQRVGELQMNLAHND